MVLGVLLSPLPDRPPAFSPAGLKGAGVEIVQQAVWCTAVGQEQSSVFTSVFIGYCRVWCLMGPSVETCVRESLLCERESVLFP